MSNQARRREEDAEKAYQLQVNAGLKLSARATAIGTGLAIITHYAWPAFRRQPISFKAFLVMGFSITGLVFGAENALLEYEAHRRVEESIIRREAHLALVRGGTIPTETEIAKWRSDKEAANGHEPPA